jgi:hypothetical protein
MGKVTGLLMIVAGVGTAAFVYPLVTSSNDQAERQLADVVTISTNSTAAKPAPIVVAPITKGDVATAKPAQVPFVSPNAVAGLVPTAPTAPQVQTPTAPLAIKPLEVAQAPAIIAPPKSLPAKTVDEGKLALTREIQRELKRVGCYAGDTDGVWNTETRGAMKTFIDRVNATLPTDGPDHILKTLVQGHPGNACGKSCPTGQGLSSEGRCLPTAILAQGVKKPAVREPSRDVAGSQGAAPNSAPNRAVTTGWDSTVASNRAPPARGTTLNPPTVVADAPASNPAPSAKGGEALPGRMAIGAPANAEPVAAPARNEPAPTITVKPKAKAPKPVETAALNPPPSPSQGNAPPLGAVEATGQEPSNRAAARAPAAERRAPTPPVAIYRAPPPPIRYVGASYSPPPQRVYRDRPRFGPQIFRDLDRAGR